MCRVIRGGLTTPPETGRMKFAIGLLGILPMISNLKQLKLKLQVKRSNIDTQIRIKSVFISNSPMHTKEDILKLNKWKKDYEEITKQIDELNDAILKEI